MLVPYELTLTCANEGVISNWHIYNYFVCKASLQRKGIDKNHNKQKEHTPTCSSWWGDREVHQTYRFPFLSSSSVIVHAIRKEKTIEKGPLPTIAAAKKEQVEGAIFLTFFPPNSFIGSLCSIKNNRKRRWRERYTIKSFPTK